MRTVEDERGRRYLLEQRSGASSRVWDPATGEVRHLPTDSLSAVDGVDPLAAAAGAAPAALRERFSGLPDDRAAGLLLVLAGAPRPVRTLLGATDLCESDLLGLASELRAAGLVAETEVDGERGYAPTAAGRAAVEEARQSEDAGSAEAGD